MGLGKKEGGGVFEGGLIPQCPLCTLRPWLPRWAIIYNTFLLFLLKAYDVLNMKSINQNLVQILVKLKFKGKAALKSVK